MSKEKQSEAGRHRSKTGFTLVEIMIVIAIVGLLAIMAMPNYVRVRDFSQTNVCLNNLRVLSGAKAQFAIEARLTHGDGIAPAELDPYMRKPFAELDEPAGYEYTVGAVGTSPACTLGAPHEL